MRSLRRQRLACQDQLHRDVLADGAGEPVQAAGAGDEVPLHFGEAERGAGGGDDHVSGEDDLAPAGRGQAVDGCDHGLLPVAVRETGEAALARAERRALSRVDRLQIRTGAEDRPVLTFGVRCDDADPDLVVFLEAVDDRLHRGRDLAVHGVASLGTVQSDDAHAPLHLVLHDV
jgi:hypothetical protein